MKSKFERINRLPPYIFGEINSLKMKLRSEGRDIIDFGMGNPDMPTPLHIRQKLKEVIDKPGVGRYSVSKGINGLRKAQAKYYKKRFDVDLNPSSEIIVTIGSKEGLANLAQAITSKGDRILILSELKNIDKKNFQSKIKSLINQSYNRIYYNPTQHTMI